MYFDFFKLHDGSFGVVIAEPLQSRLETPIYIATLRGTIRALIRGQEKFSLPTFLSTLNRLVQEDPIQQQYKFAFLNLSPTRDELNFLSWGFGNLLHFSPGGQLPRILTNNHPPLGTNKWEDLELTIDNWNIGDVVVLHSCDSSQDELIQQSLKENFLLSPQNQADTFLKKISSQSSEKKTKVLFTIHRIG
ncbi:MAG TPA: hypothetical protein PKW79_02025 [Rhabdochlamydiaceae bacterium]|nr:hypothetical protein [Rhabdochlamydiaceae bacterium]